MGEHTSIGWTHHTFPGWWGCEKVAPECKHCYAAAFSERKGLKLWGAAAPRREFGDAYWAKPLEWNRRADRAGERRRVFCSSMADVFEDHPVAARSRPRLFELIEQTPWLDWLLLSKRPQNMVAMAPAAWAKGWPFNVWAGTSAGCQDSANAFVHHITQVPAPVRFVSAEPLLGRVDLSLRLGVQRCPWGWTEQTGRIAHLEWIIVGGESGAPRREMDLEAAADLVAQARAARVPVFVKQDSHRYPGQRGRLSDAMWALKQLPSPRWSALGPRAA